MESYTKLPIYYGSSYNIGDLRMKSECLQIKLSDDINIQNIAYTALCELVKNSDCHIYIRTRNEIPEFGLPYLKHNPMMLVDGSHKDQPASYEYMITWNIVKQLLPQSIIELAIKEHYDELMHRL